MSLKEPLYLVGAMLLCSTTWLYSESRTIWSFDTDGWVYAAPAVADETVYVGSCSGVYYALDRQTGKLRWSYDTQQDGGAAQFHGASLQTDELVITGSDQSPKGSLRGIHPGFPGPESIEGPMEPKNSGGVEHF